jgi:hypothetical protein
MEMENRNFQLDTEWNVVHYPYQPTGFGILIIGDERNFVDKEFSFWTQNEGRLSLINDFKQAGYTAFYSNLYGKNWGSEKAVKLAKQLYFYMIRNEILNQKIHIFAEGMGALVALKLMKEMKQYIRSIVLLNPIYSLKTQLDQEREHKFFYKKLIKEIALAYDINPKSVEQMVHETESPPELPSDIPLKIIHILNGARSYKLSEISNTLTSRLEKEGTFISVSYILPDNVSQINKFTMNFLKNCENTI